MQGLQDPIESIAGMGIIDQQHRIAAIFHRLETPWHRSGAGDTALDDGGRQIESDGRTDGTEQILDVVIAEQPAGNLHRPGRSVHRAVDAVQRHRQLLRTNLCLWAATTGQRFRQHSCQAPAVRIIDVDHSPPVLPRQQFSEEP